MLGISGMISCDNVIIGPDMYGCPPAPEYGVPVVEFRITGKVVDADSNPIPDIEVSNEDAYEKVRTSEDGTFVFSGEAIGSGMDRIELVFTDLDGEENGGEFVTKVESVPVVQIDEGDGNWYNGDYSAENIEIVMERK